MNCVAAYERLGGPCMAIDFGTATTYDVVNEKGEFIAGITSPGIRICADAMFQRAAQLPHIEIKKLRVYLMLRIQLQVCRQGLCMGT